jgi:hypothetical protein
MNKKQKVVISLGIFVLIVMVLFPPYAGGKKPLGEAVHGSLGFHPIWNPPDAEYAYEALIGEEYDPAEGTDLSEYVVIFNKVGFIFNVIVLLLVSSVLLMVFRKKKQKT